MYLLSLAWLEISMCSMCSKCSMKPFYRLIQCIQYIDIKYVLHHVLQLAFRVPKGNIFEWLFALIILTNLLTYLLTHSLSYPKSRDAIASKKNNTHVSFIPISIHVLNYLHQSVIHHTSMTLILSCCNANIVMTHHDKLKFSWHENDEDKKSCFSIQRTDESLCEN